MTDGASRPASAINQPVFWASALLLIALLAYVTLFTARAQALFSALLDGVSTRFGWLYVSSIASFILFALWLLFSRRGDLRLAANADERPEFSTIAWFSMLFSAGMGIGLVFYGVAEPVMHYAQPPPGSEAMGADAALRNALPLTFFHWGIHAWAIYVLMGLGMAYFAHRKGLPLSLRSCLHPLLGDRIHGVAGHVIDVIAVFGTLFGLATSLGLGARQVSAGLARLFGTPHTLTAQLILIAVITLAATVSLVTGLKNGIRRLSELNLLLAASLVAFVFVVGPTTFILDVLVQGLGRYGRTIIERTFAVGAYGGEAKTWAKSWTLFYWGWWIAWAPFVGTFIARISRGRTVRELVAAALVVPTAVTVVWFSVLGGTALHLERNGGGVATAVTDDVSTAIYAVLEQLPLAPITSLLAATVVIVFFVTSSDSASYVVDMITSGGNPNPPRWQRIFWATAEGACAAVLLYAGGEQALQALQAAVVSVGLPVCLILLGIAYCLMKSLLAEPV